MNTTTCRKTLQPCQTPGMCAPHGGCSDSYRQQWADGEIEAGTLLDAIDALQQRCRELEEERAEQWRLRRDAEADRDTNRAAVLELRGEVDRLKADRRACWAEFKAAHRMLDDEKRERDTLRAEVERLRQGTLRIEIARHIAPADRWHWAVVLPSGHVFAVGESFASPELCAADAALAGMSTLHAAKNAIEANL